MSSLPTHNPCALYYDDGASFPTYLCLKSLQKATVCNPEAGLPSLQALRFSHLSDGCRTRGGAGVGGIVGLAASQGMADDAPALVFTGAPGHRTSWWSHLLACGACFPKSFHGVHSGGSSSSQPGDLTI